jgi:hypothetical protein
MRPAFTLVLIASSAWAEPLIIRPVPEPVPAQPDVPALGSNATGAPGVHDVWASGIVIAPPAHADMHAWPRGMVMTPPDVRDRNVLGLGGLELPGRPDSWALPAARAWPSWLSRGLAHGIAGLLDWMIPVGL